MKKILLVCCLLYLTNNLFAQCSASFTYNFAPYGNLFLEYNFSNTSTFSPGPYLSASYVIDYGDGNSGAIGLSSSHNYAAAGTYTVMLTQTIFDSLNMTVSCTSTSSHVLNVGYSPCEAGYTHSIVSYDNTQQTIAFSAYCLANTPGITYAWNFGDGSTGIGATPTHTYTVNAYYSPTLTATGGGCTYSFHWSQVAITNIFNCSTANTNFSSSINYNTVIFHPASGYCSPGQDTLQTWDYGDGSSGQSGVHTYASTGTYTVTLTTEWTDTVGNGTNSLCTKTATNTVTITSFPPPPPNIISGNIQYYGVLPNNGTAAKVWLITFDPNTNLLEAIDSTISTNDSNSYYQFTNEPAGSYRVKAALINNNPPGTSGYVPTYDVASLYWSGAAVFPYTSGLSGYHDIHMQYGTVPAGPGFIAGNVLYGANKKTQGGAPETGMMIYLRNASNNVITYTYTDANGNFSFSNVANGTYSIYPEAMNYATTPITNISVNGTVNNIDFYKHTMSMTITPNTEGVNNVVNANSVAVFPNPTSGNITLHWNTVKSENAQVSVADITGRKVFSAPVNMSAGSGDAKLNLSQLPEGVYIMNIKSADLNQVEKINISK